MARDCSDGVRLYVHLALSLPSTELTVKFKEALETAEEMVSDRNVESLFGRTTSEYAVWATRDRGAHSSCSFQTAGLLPCFLPTGSCLAWPTSCT